MSWKPKDFQQADLATLKQHNYTGVLAIEPGGGKTALSLFAAADAGANQTLVIAPKNTFSTAWMKTVPNIQGYEARVVGNNNKETRQALQDMEWGVPGVFLVSPQLFTRADITNWKPDMLIVDEVHQLNRPGAKGQRKLSGYSVRDEPISRQVGASLTLSGTPVRASFERAWAICRLHWPELNRRGEVAYENYYGWLAERMKSRKFAVGRDSYGGVKYATEWLSERDEGRLFSEMPCVIQHFRRSMCCWYHPNGFLEFEKPNEVERVVELTPAQKRIIGEFEDQGLAWIGDHPFQVELPMTLQQRIRQTCLGVPEVKFTGEVDENDVPKVTLDFPEDTPSPFLDETLNILEQLGDEPVAIYLSSQKFASVLTKRLNEAGISAFEFSGKTAGTREANLRKFGTEFRVVVGVVSAIGTGTDEMQTVCKNEIWLEVPLDDVDAQQAEARLDRLGAIGQIQRFRIHDDMGYSKGMFGKKLEKRLQVARSTRKTVE